MTLYKLIYTPSNRVVASRIARADSVWSKGIGLIGRRTLGQDEGLWLPGVASVHTFGVLFPIDILFLDENLRGVAVYSAVRPGRVVTPAESTRHCIELTADALLPDERMSRIAVWRIEP